MLDQPAAQAHSIDAQAHARLSREALDNPDAFWGRVGSRLSWIRRPSKVKNASFAPGNVSIKWFEDGALNVSANCIDRHVATAPDRVAIIWEPDDPS